MVARHASQHRVGKGRAGRERRYGNLFDPAQAPARPVQVASRAAQRIRQTCKITIFKTAIGADELWKEMVNQRQGKESSKLFVPPDGAGGYAE